MNSSSVRDYAHLKTFVLPRWVYGPDHKLHLHEFMVRASGAIAAAEMVRYLVAQDYAAFAPVDKSMEIKANKRRKRTKGGE